MEHLIPATEGVPLSSKSAKDFSTQLFAFLKDNPGRALGLWEELQFFTKVQEALKEQPGFTQFMREQILATEQAALPEAAPGEAAVELSGRIETAQGGSFKLSAVGTKYDYPSCNDPAWEHYDHTIKDYTEKKKGREKLLKALDTPTVMQFQIPDGSTVARKVYPPTVSSTDSFTLNMAK